MKNNPQSTIHSPHIRKFFEISERPQVGQKDKKDHMLEKRPQANIWLTQQHNNITQYFNWNLMKKFSIKGKC